jgi:hypothetical protein
VTCKKKTSACVGITSDLYASSTVESGAGVYVHGYPYSRANKSARPCMCSCAHTYMPTNTPSYCTEPANPLVHSRKCAHVKCTLKAHTHSCPHHSHTQHNAHTCRGRVSELVSAGEILKGERDALLKLIQVGRHFCLQHIISALSNEVHDARLHATHSLSDHAHTCVAKHVYML